MQKMAVALLETIESKNKLTETLTLENRTHGTRLQSLVRHLADEDGETLPKAAKQKEQLDCLTTPPEIEFEQPHRSLSPEDDFISVTNVNLKQICIST